MNKRDFYYDLPEELIAQHPPRERTASRLLHLEGENGACHDRQFTELLSLLRPNDLMVFNDTRVIPARLFGRKSTGGQLEILLERFTPPRRVIAHVRASKAPKPGSQIVLDDGTLLDVVGRRDALFELEFPDGLDVLDKLNQIGHMPLPPYIERSDEHEDRERYQTVFGKHLGAVAAPTAGLHFDDSMLDKISNLGVDTAFVTLHVGAGTFQPVRVDNILEHKMHAEIMHLNQSVCDQVATAKQRGGRVIAVGTTSVRCLETAAQSGTLLPYKGETDIFIYPGVHFNVVDCLITNFHLPESTLMMLVSAFAGYQHTMAAYQHAVKKAYRFFSYGDAMFIEKNSSASTETVGISVE